MVSESFIQFKQFCEIPHLRHCYTTRKGGVSNGVFESLNMGPHRGDLQENVEKNYQHIARLLDIEATSYVLSDQVHGTVIRQVSRQDCGSVYEQPGHIKGVDGLITNETHVALTTFYADCIPLYFYDPMNKAIGMAHAGWRGTVAKIGMKCIIAMQEAYGTKAEDILVGIGPGIGACCYEVSEDVKKEFELSFNDDIIAKIVSTPYRDDRNVIKYKIDLVQANLWSLISFGVKPASIEVSNLCTKCCSDLFFSHRVMGKDRGSQVGVLAMVDADA